MLQSHRVLIVLTSSEIFHSSSSSCRISHFTNNLTMTSCRTATNMFPRGIHHICITRPDMSNLRPGAQLFSEGWQPSWTYSWRSTECLRGIHSWTLGGESKRNPLPPKKLHRSHFPTTSSALIVCVSSAQGVHRYGKRLIHAVYVQ